MGFLDRFRRKPKSFEDLIKDLPKARTLHYVFAHIALRQLAFEHPLGVVGTLHSPKAAEFLRSVWDDVAEQVKRNGEPVDIDASALAVSPVRVGDYPCALVRLPPPQAATECYYVALVLHVDLREEAAAAAEPPPEKPRLSYFTLEYGASLDGSERSVVCAWDEAGSHLNYGDGPWPPAPEAFAGAVTRLIRRDNADDVRAGFNPGSGGTGVGGDTE
jgi:hypothetical protein